MKMAIKDGKLILAELSGEQVLRIRNWGTMTWNKTRGTMTGKADFENLSRLSKMVRLPEVYQTYLDELKARRDRIESERFNPDPVPLVHYPVKAKLYKHQLRGANMAMLVFGEVDDDKKQV